MPGSSILIAMARRSFTKRHQRKAAKARIAKLTEDELRDRMIVVASGNQWTDERRAEVARRLTEGRAKARLELQSKDD